MPRKLSHNGLVTLRLAKSDARQTYSGLLWEAERKGFKAGWVKHKFREIFGGWPNPQSPVKPTEPASDLREWLKMQSRRFRAKKVREEAKATVAVKPVAAEVMENSLMSDDDWKVRL